MLYCDKSEILLKMLKLEKLKIWMRIEIKIYIKESYSHNLFVYHNLSQIKIVVKTYKLMY